MSATATPITPQAFAEALKSLPLSSLYAKASELRNSIAHLQRSNDELARYIAEDSPDGRDKDCEDAIRENEVVIVRMQGRIELLKVEVEGRGQRWSEEMDMDMNVDADANMNGEVGGDVDMGGASAGDGARPTMGMTAGNDINGDLPSTTMRASAQSTGAQNGTTAAAAAANAGQNDEGDDEAQRGEGGVYL
ncbi:hypothetical protein EMCG_08457 [[Emmonsia] crescens]|uniref:Uncharacterized protein n=1 Tax=[Emmonsia] crescens TaxID=73230 RepID=A0A0G2JAH7_9EURO|nr:hypothetical protein EMCG_08457 [Emmonsia crescens UAMH 3008]